MINIKILFRIIFLFLIIPVQTSASESIVYLDLQYILSNSLAGKSIISQIKKIENDNAKLFIAEEKNLKKEETKLISKKNILNENEFNSKVIELKKKINSYNQKKKNSIDDMNKKNFNAQNKILGVLKNKLADYAEKNSIKLILQKNNILLGANEIDITKTIMVLLNKEIKTVNIK